MDEDGRKVRLTDEQVDTLYDALCAAAEYYQGVLLTAGRLGSGEARVIQEKQRKIDALLEAARGGVRQVTVRLV